jgi:hypothetical protein
MDHARLIHGRPRDDAELRGHWAALRADARAVAGMTATGDWWGLLRHTGDPPAPDDAFAACFEPAPTLLDSADLQVLLAGSPAPGAGFVQIMRARVRNRAAWAAADELAVPLFAAARPDFLGTLRMWQGDRLAVVDSFSSEAQARAGEARGATATEQAAYDAWFAHLADVEWHDLTAPW